MEQIMNLRDFSDEHGEIQTIIRRHFDYEVPSGLESTAGGGYGSLLGALIYTRGLDSAKLGLTPEGAIQAFEHGEKLATMGVAPKTIICGIDQRNYDGARFTRAGIRKVSGIIVPYLTSPAVTYPHYSNPTQLANVIDQFADEMVHMYLAEQEEVRGLWTEPARVFEARIVSAITADYPNGTPVLFDLNFEQITLLYYLFIKKVKRLEIPFEKGNVWLPTKGGGIAIAIDKAAVEFTPQLEVIQ